MLSGIALLAKGFCTKMNPKIIIGICTRQRNPELQRLLDSLAAQTVPDNATVQIIIVDNNDAPSAAAAVEGAALPFAISFHHEPRAGLVYARNRALDIAEGAGADWFIGLDDDEWVSPDWLEHYVAALKDGSGQEMRMGPCRLVYAENASRFLGKKNYGFQAYGRRPVTMTTQNFAIHRSVFDRQSGTGLRFHMAFNETGGEDLEFFLRAVRQHQFRAGAVPDAIVYEDRKGARAKLKYRLFRTFRNQISFHRVVQLHRQDGLRGTRLSNAKRALMSAARSFLFGARGLLTGVLLLPFQRDRGMKRIGKALQRWARVAALFAFVLGMVPIAYGKTRKPN